MHAPRTATRVLLAAVFAGFLCLYALTAQRGACWQDSGVRQWRVLTADYAGVEGLALSHPLYIGLARLFVQVCPAGETLFRLNLFSGVGMALALSLLALLVRRLTGSVRAAAGAALLLGLAHMPWWLATVTEVYTWSLAALLLELVLLQSLLAAPRPRTLVALALVSGLGVSLHNFALLSLPVLLVAAVLLVRCGMLPRRALGWGALALAIGCAPLLALVVQDVLERHSVGAALSSVLFGNAYQQQVLGVQSATMRFARPNLCLFLLNFATPCWLLLVAGLWQARRLTPGPFRLCLLALTAIHALFFLRYFVADQALFALPTLALLAVWAGLGLGWLLQRTPPGRVAWVTALLLALLLSPPAVYAGVRRVVARHDLAPHRARALPFRDEARYWILPWKCDESSAARFVAAVRLRLPARATLVADGAAAGPLLATAAAEGRTTAFRLVTPYDRTPTDVLRLGRAAPEQPLYVVSPVPGYAPPELLGGEFSFVEDGVVYRVTPAASAPR